MSTVVDTVMLDLQRQIRLLTLKLSSIATEPWTRHVVVPPGEVGFRTAVDGEALAIYTVRESGSMRLYVSIDTIWKGSEKRSRIRQTIKRQLDNSGWEIVDASDDPIPDAHGERYTMKLMIIKGRP